jgi:hypothetical protein
MRLIISKENDFYLLIIIEMNSPSAVLIDIMVEIHKKYILASLILNGEVPP